MHSSVRDLLAALVVSAFLAGSATAQTVENLSITPAQWREDLEFLKRELPKCHKNAFHYTPREQFEASIADLESKVDRLNPDEIFVGMARILSAVGDGHSFAVYPRSLTQFPIGLNRFGADIRVSRVPTDSPALEKALGAKVTKIDGMDIARVLDLLAPLASQDELPAFQQRQAILALNIGMVLHGLGIVKEPGKAHYTLRSDNGEEFTVEIAAVPSVELKDAD